MVWIPLGNNHGPLSMSEPDGKPTDGAAEPAPTVDDAKLAAMLERLVVGADKGKLASLPFGGAVIKIDKSVYEPSRLTISSFSIKPYEGQLVAGQMFQASILLPGEEEAIEVAVAGAVKTLDADFGLRAIFSSPQPAAQRALALHLMELRKHEPPPEIKAKKKGLWK